MEMHRQEQFYLELCGDTLESTFCVWLRQHTLDSHVRLHA